MVFRLIQPVLYKMVDWAFGTIRYIGQHSPAAEFHEKVGSVGHPARHVAV